MVLFYRKNEFAFILNRSRDEEIPRMRYEANSGTAVFLLAFLFSDIISPQLFIFSPILLVLVLMGYLQSHLQLLTENSHKTQNRHGDVKSGSKASFKIQTFHISNFCPLLRLSCPPAQLIKEPLLKISSF